MRLAKLAPLALLLLVGCSDNERIPVTGTVTLDGQPLAEGAISFAMSNGAVAGGGAVKDGKFELGLPAGKYKVSVTASKPVPGKTIPEMGNEPVLQSAIPAKFNSKTTLTAEIGANSGPLSFALTSK